MALATSGTDDDPRALGGSVASTQRYSIDRPRVIEELIGEELVVISFKTGKYHGIRGTGVAIWRLLDAGHSVREVVDQIARHFSVDERSTQRIAAFVGELEAQELIVPTARDAPESDPAARGLSGTQFSDPQLETRDDLQDHLALDPIHDVDEYGWPRPKTTVQA